MSAIDTVFVPDPELPTFGRFRAVGELGSGAMGAVYRAHDETLGRDVAIKTLHAIRDDATLRERFLREARAVSVLSHPNIVAVYDIGTKGTEPYLVMELANGGSLKSRMKSGPLPVEQVRQLGIQIAHALAAAHARDILHRDVKPANILATGTGTWKLADFGIARLPGSRLTITGQFLGSPAYAAPESLAEGKFSPASDVYGLAATLYEAVTGETPHGVHDLGSLIQHLNREPVPPGQRVSLPASVDTAITRALARDPAQRPSAEQFANLLAEREGAVAVVPLATAGSGVASWRKLAFATLLIAGIIGALMMSRGSSPGTAANVRDDVRGVPGATQDNVLPSTLGSPGGDQWMQPATYPTPNDGDGAYRRRQKHRKYKSREEHDDDD